LLRIVRSEPADAEQVLNARPVNKNQNRPGNPSNPAKVGF